MPDNSNKSWSLEESYGLMFRSFLKIGYQIRNDREWIKVVVYVTVLCGMLLYLCWESMLFSHFAVSLTTPPFNNLKEFLSKTDQKVILILDYKIGSFISNFLYDFNQFK